MHREVHFENVFVKAALLGTAPSAQSGGHSDTEQLENKEELLCQVSQDCCCWMKNAEKKRDRDDYRDHVK